MRLVPWSRWSNYAEFPSLAEEKPDGSTALLLRKGEILLRDARVAHGGSPNRCDVDRVLPGIQLHTPLWDSQYSDSDHVPSKPWGFYGA